MLKSSFIAVVGLGVGFACGYLLSSERVISELSSTSGPEMLFAVRYQSADYTLAALEKIKQNNIQAASSILEVSLALDEAEMAVCANSSNLCSPASQQAFIQLKQRRSAYLGK